MTVAEFRKALLGNGLTRDCKEWLEQWWWDYFNGLYKRDGVTKTSADGDAAAVRQLAQIVAAYSKVRGGK